MRPFAGRDARAAVVVAPGPFEIDGSPLALGSGGWLLDLDLECLPGNRLAIDRSSGDVLLADVRVLRTATGTPGACLETSPLSTGAAYVEQDDLGKGRIRFRTALLRPEGEEQLPYRLGLKVFELSEGKLFGVWSLDFPLAPRVQHGTLTRSARTFWNPSVRICSSAHATAAESPGVPAKRGPTRLVSERSSS